MKAGQSDLLRSMFCKCLKKKCSLLVSNTPQRRRISLSRLNSLTLHRQAVISTKEVSKRLLLTAWPMYYQFFLVIPCRYIVMLKGVSTYETSFITEVIKVRVLLLWMKIIIITK